MSAQVNELARLIAAAALVETAQTEALDARAERERVEAQERAEETVRRRTRATRLDDLIVTWTIRLIAVGVVAATALGIWAWHDAPSIGQLFLHVWWAVVITALSIAIVGALATLIRWPWTGRIPLIVVAVIVAATSVVGIVYSAPRLAYQNVMGTGFDFDGRYYTCGEAVRIPIRPTGGSDIELWQMFRAKIKDSEGSGCNRVILYKGKDRVSAYDLLDGDTFLPASAPGGGAAMFATLDGKPLKNSDIIDASLGDVTFYARSRAGLVVSVSPAHPYSWHP